MRDTFLSRELHFQHNMGTAAPPEEVRLERVIIGDGVHQPPEAVEAVRCNVFVANDTLFRNYSVRAINWWGADATYTVIAATNCDFNGDRDGAPSFDIEPTSGGELNHSRKTQWLGNRRKNDGTGSAAQFTDTNDSDNILGTTQDASLHVYANSAKPTSNLVTWAVGDIVMNDSPTSPGYIGWVCTNATSPPGTWKEWGAIS